MKVNPYIRPINVSLIIYKKKKQKQKLPLRNPNQVCVTDYLERQVDVRSDSPPIPKSMPLPAAPRRAGPPRKKPAKVESPPVPPLDPAAGEPQVPPAETAEPVSVESQSDQPPVVPLDPSAGEVQVPTPPQLQIDQSAENDQTSLYQRSPSVDITSPTQWEYEHSPAPISLSGDVPEEDGKPERKQSLLVEEPVSPTPPPRKRDSVGSVASQQPHKRDSVGSIASQQPHKRDSVGSIASQQPHKRDSVASNEASSVPPPRRSSSSSTSLKSPTSGDDEGDLVFFVISSFFDAEVFFSSYHQYSSDY